jgi:hypothetical protein
MKCTVSAPVVYVLWNTLLDCQVLVGIYTKKELAKRDAKQLDSFFSLKLFFSIQCKKGDVNMFLDDYFDTICAFKNKYSLYAMCIYDIRCSTDSIYIIFTDGLDRSYYYHIKNKTLRTQEEEIKFLYNY